VSFNTTVRAMMIAHSSAQKLLDRPGGKVIKYLGSQINESVVCVVLFFHYSCC
jgi:hypothetical protein